MKEFIVKNKEKCIFILILIIAIFIRLFSWPTAISDVNCDEAMTAINAYSIANFGTDTHGISFPVYLEAWGIGGQSVVLLYIMAFFIKIFGFSFITVRLPMLFISIISLLIFYDLLKRIFNNKKIAIIGFAFLAICPWHIMQSIWSMDCNMFPHFILISIYLLYRGIKDKKWLLYLSMFFFAITMYTYGVSVYIVPLFLLITAIYLLKTKQVNIKELLLCILIYFIFSLPILTMYFINFFKINTNIHIGPITIQYFEQNVRSADMLFFSENVWQTLKNNLMSIFKIVFTGYDHLEWNATHVFGTIYHGTVIFFIIGIIYYFKEKKKLTKQEVDGDKLGFSIMFIWVVLSLIMGIVINNVNINRLNTIWYPMIFFITLGINYVINKKKILKYIIFTLYTIVFIAFSIYFYGYYTQKINMSGCFSRRYIEAVTYAKTINENNLPVIYFNEKEDGALDVYTKFQAQIDNTEIECIKDRDKLLEKLLDRKQIIIINKQYIENNILFEKTDISYLNQTTFEDYIVIKSVDTKMLF